MKPGAHQQTKEAIAISWEQEMNDVMKVLFIDMSIIRYIQIETLASAYFLPALCKTIRQTVQLVRVQMVRWQTLEKSHLK